MNLQKSLEKKAALETELQAMFDKVDGEARYFTDEEAKAFDEKKAELNSVESHIERIKMLPAKTEQKEVTKTVGSSFVAGSVAEPAKKEFSELREFMEAAMFNHNDQRLDYVQAEQSMGTGSKGGFAVPSQFVAGIRSKAGSASIIRSRAEVLPAGTPPDSDITLNALDQQPRDGVNQVYGGVIVSHIEEGGLKGETDFNLRQVTLKPKEIAAYIPMTDKLLRNWAAASSFAANQLTAAVTNAEEFDFFQGNTAGRALGVIPSSASYLVNRNTASDVKFTDIKKMLARFDGDESRAVWVASRAVKEKLLSLVGDGGGATNIISVDRSTGGITIYGIPLLFSSRVPGLGVKGDFGLYNFGSYLIKDGSGPIVEVGFAAGQWERNKRSVKVTWNVDGTPWNTAPYMNEDDYEVSPFVVLDVPSGS